ncbi:MerR family transcriptional regulator [Monashia sp. NPDC004114]
MSSTGYSIGDVAQLTGVGASTLRAWESRYALVTPARTDSSYRSYSDRDLDVIRRMRVLVDSGVPPRRAAGMALETVDQAASVAEGPPAPAGSVLADHASLARAAARFDADALQHTLDEAFALASAERVIDDWLMPSLTRLGDAWEAGEIDVAAEHFVTAAVMRRLAALFEATRAYGPRVLVGLPPGARHELPALAFAVCLRRAGIDVLYLGADVPLDSWVAVVRASSPRAAVISAAHEVDIASAEQTVQALTTAGVGVVYVGGRAAARLQSGTPLPQQLSSAADLVRAAIEQRPG